MSSVQINTPSSSKVAPLILVVASVFMLVAMSHHPVVTSTTISDALAQLVAMARLDRMVHGALIVLLGAVLLAHVELSARMGWNHAAVRTALVLYMLGVFSMFGAALIDGFSVSWVGESYARESPIDYESFRHVVRAMELGGVQPLTSLGALLMASGVIGWSFSIRSRARWLAVLGFATATVSLVGLLSGWLVLDKQGAMLVLGCQCLWNVAVGLQWLRSASTFAMNP